MINDIDKIGKANNIILKLANGIDPVNGEVIENDNVLNDPRMIRCFFFVSKVLENVIAGEYSKASKKTKFIITDEQKDSMIFTEGEIGVNEISKCINQNINPLISKKVTGNLINRGLKRMGILSEINNDDGTRRTAINETSHNYGFIEIERNYNGRKYFQVVANDIGKKFILDNIEEVLSKDNGKG